MKTTRKTVEARNATIISVGYCDLVYTLREAADHRDGHLEGVYGWNADVFEFDTFAIVTGYRPFGKHLLSFDFCKRWEKKAKDHYTKVNAPNAHGRYRTTSERDRMRYTFRCQFERAVQKEIARQRSGETRGAA